MIALMFYVLQIESNTIETIVWHGGDKSGFAVQRQCWRWIWQQGTTSITDPLSSDMLARQELDLS